MSNLGTRHPSGEELLHFADGEMAAPASEEIRGHLKACWHCRHELEEIEQTIRECVRYREVVLDTCLPSPPDPWFDIYPRLAKIDEMQNRQRRMSRILQPLAGLFSYPRRWVPAVATVVLVAVLVEQFREAPSVQAAELLRKAIAAESRPQTVRRIRIRTRTKQLTRAIGNAGSGINTSLKASSLPELESLFQAAHYNWEDPLSAKSYADWRNQLSGKRDEVSLISNYYQLRTTADSGELAEATLKLDSTDFHTMESTLQFRNHDRVDISELPDVPSASLDAANGVAGTAAAVPSPMKSRPPLESQPMRVTPGDELAVVAVLHRLGADLGDPVEVTRTDGEILVTGSGIARDRQLQISDQLRTIPRVAVRFSAETAAELPAPDERSPSRIFVGPGSGPLQADMEKRLGGRAPFEQFADDVFDLTDRFMSRAHALRRLAQRFPRDAEAQMTSDQRLLLDRLREDHADVLLENVTAAERRMDAVLGLPPADVQDPRGSGQWQPETEQLFSEARHAESMLIALLGTSQDQAQPLDLPAQTAATLAQLRKRAESYQRLTIRP